MKTINEIKYHIKKTCDNVTEKCIAFSQKAKIVVNGQVFRDNQELKQQNESLIVQVQTLKEELRTNPQPSPKNPLLDAYLVRDEIVPIYANSIYQLICRYYDKADVLLALASAIRNQDYLHCSDVELSEKFSAEFKDETLGEQVYKLMNIVRRFDSKIGDYGKRLQNHTAKDISAYFFSPSTDELFNPLLHQSLNGHQVSQIHQCIFPGIKDGNIVFMKAIVR